MAIRTFTYPAPNASVGTTGVTAPTSATEIAGIDGSGNLQAVTVKDVGGDQSLAVDVRHSVLPDGAATEATLSAIAATQTDGTQETQLVDSSGNIAGDFYPDGGSNFALRVRDSATAASNITSTYMSVIGGLNDSNQSKFIHVDTNGHIKENIFDSNGASIVNGQQTSTNSLPVVVASDQTAIPVSGTVTANQGTANSLANAWSTKLTDGTNGPAAIKPASTAAIATDPALVVAISPNNSLTVSNSANGNTGSAVPAQATQVGGTDGTNLRALSVDTTGKLNVNNISGTVSLPTNAAQETGGNLAALAGTVVSTSSLPGNTTGLLIAGEDTTGTTYPLQTTAAGVLKVNVSNTVTTTNAALALAQGSTTSGQTGPLIQAAVTTSAPSYTSGQTDPLSLTTAGALRVDGSAVTQPVSGTVTANAGTNLNTSLLALDTSVTGLQVSQGSTTSGQKGELIQGAVTTAAPSYTTAQTSPLSLTTAGALRVDGSAVTQPVSISGNQAVNVAQIAGTTTDTNTGNSSAGTQRVVLASDQPIVTVNSGGKSKANAPVRNDYTSTNVTTSAYTQLVASTTSATSEIEIFDSSGQTLKLATGAAASEVDQILIFPGGNGRVPLLIPAGTRVSIKAVSATASVGEIDINFYT